MENKIKELENEVKKKNAQNKTQKIKAMTPSGDPNNPLNRTASQFATDLRADTILDVDTNPIFSDEPGAINDGIPNINQNNVQNNKQNNNLGVNYEGVPLPQQPMTNMATPGDTPMGDLDEDSSSDSMYKLNQTDGAQFQE